jgi:hypothetical protein
VEKGKNQANLTPSNGPTYRRWGNTKIRVFRIGYISVDTGENTSVWVSSILYAY